MAVETTATSANFVGTGALSTYSPGFYANASDQIVVTVDNVVQTIGDDYVINNLGASAGIDILATFTLDSAVVVSRVTPITQIVDTKNNETILEDVLDGALDKLTMIAQEIDARMALLGAGLTAGFSHSAAYPVATAGRKMQQFLDPRDAPFNAAANGATDDTAALQAALTLAALSGRKVWLQKGVTYAFGSRLTIPDGGGFIGGGKLLMLTGEGKFSASDYSLPDSWTNVGLYALNMTDVVLECEVEMQANASTRTCSAIAVRGCTNPLIDVQVHGFGAAREPIVAWDSNRGGFARVRGWDCTTSDDTLPSMQVTLFCVDASRTSGNSTGLIFDVYGRNIMITGAAAQAFGYQSDICNIQTTGYCGFIGRVYGEDCGEILDCFGDGNIIQVIAKNAYEYGIKLIHGAENNLIFGTVNGFRRYGVVFGGDSDTKSVKRNRVYATVGGSIIPKTSFVATVDNGSPTITVTAITSGLNIQVGDVVHDSRFPAGTTIKELGTGTGGVGTYTASQNCTSSGVDVTIQTSPAPTAAFATDGTSATFKPIDNYVELSYTGDGVALDYGAYEAAGSRNTIRISGSGTARKISQIDGTAGQNQDATRIFNDRKTFVRAYLQAQSPAPGSFVKLQYANEVVDMTGEFDPSTYTFTATSERDICINASIRTGGAADQKEYDLQIRRNGTEILRKQCRVSGAGDFSADTGPFITHVAAGDTIDVQLNHNEGAAVALTDSETFSRLHIWEL